MIERAYYRVKFNTDTFVYVTQSNISLPNKIEEFTDDVIYSTDIGATIDTTEKWTLADGSIVENISCKRKIPIIAGEGVIVDADSTNKYVQISIDKDVLDTKYDKAGGTIGGNVIITGDLTVNGTQHINNTENLNVENAMMYSNAKGATLATNGGIGIKKNATDVYGIVYDPTSDSVKLGLGKSDNNGNFTFNKDEGEPVAIRDDSSKFTNEHLAKWDATNKKFVDSGYLVDDFVKGISVAEGQYIAYVASHDAPNDGIPVSLTKTGYSIARRYANGQIEVGDPEGDSDAVPKKYAENNFVKAINVTENTYLYAASREGPNGRLRVASTVEGGVVVQRSSSGNVRTGDPEIDYDAINRKYAEDNFVPKVSDTHGVERTYIIGTNGEQKTKIIDDLDCFPNSIAINGDINVDYDLSGRVGTLFCPEPKFNYQAANKKYVDENFIPLKQITSGAFIVPQIGYNKEIYWLGSDVNLTGSSLAQRTPESRLRATDPVDQYDLVNLQYFNAYALTSDNVKTLFGNQSIIGSGNIDLYNHDIEITGMIDSIPISIEFNRVSSKNLVVNSVNDLITLLGNEFRISVSGYLGDATSSQTIHMLSTTDGGGYLCYHISTEDYAVADITNLTITDTVTTV